MQVTIQQIYIYTVCMQYCFLFFHTFCFTDFCLYGEKPFIITNIYILLCNFVKHQFMLTLNIQIKSEHKVRYKKNAGVV